jgi:hypothetical protein
MNRAHQLAADILAVAQPLSGTSNADPSMDYRVKEGLLALPVCLPEMTLSLIHSVLLAPDQNDICKKVISSLLRDIIVQHLEMLDECDPKDPDTPTLITEEELNDLELAVKLAPLVSSTSDATTDFAQARTLYTCIGYADGALENEWGDSMSRFERESYRESIASGAILYKTLLSRTPDSTKPGEDTDDILGLIEHTALIVKYSDVVRDRGVFDIEFLTKLDSLGIVALADGAL